METAACAKEVSGRNNMFSSQFISLSVLPLNPRGKNDLPPSMFIIAKCPADSSISLQWSNYPCGSLSNHSRQCFMSSHSGTWGRDIIGLLFPLIISSPFACSRTTAMLRRPPKVVRTHLFIYFVKAPLQTQSEVRLLFYCSLLMMLGGERWR